MAESSLSAKFASPRELKRSYRAEERTWAGTASSMAALIVHRPSPESDTRPSKALSSGSFMSAVGLFSTRGAGDVAGAGRQPGEDRIEALDHVRLASDHHAIPALQSPDAAAGPHVDVVDPHRRKLLRAPDVVDVVGVATVDEDV